MFTNTKPLLFQFLTFLLSGFPLLTINGQPSDGDNNFTKDSLQAIAYFNIADTSYMNVDKCIRYTQLAIPLLKKTQQWEKYIHLLAGLSYCYNVKEEYDSLEINNTLAFEEAQKYLPPDNYLYMATLNNLAIVYSVVRQDYETALEHYKKALNSSDSINTNIGFKASILKNIGQIYLKKGDFERSTLYLQEALSNYEEAFKNPVYREANIRFRIVEVYQILAKVNQYQNNYSEAQRYLKDMLHLMQTNTKTFNNRYYVYCYTNLTEIALEQNNFPEAESYLKTALRLHPLTNQQKAEINRLFSKVMSARGDWQSALSLANLAIQLVPKEKPVDLSATYFVKAQALFGNGEFQETLEILDGAIQQLVPNGQLTDSSLGLPRGLKILSRIDLIKLLQLKASCFKALFQLRAEPDLLISALNCFFRVSKLSDQLQQNYQSEESKIFLNESTHPFYEEGIAVAYQLYQISQDPAYLDQAFYFFEKSKAVVLLDEIKAKEAAGVFTIPSELVNREYQLRVDINYYQKLVDKASQKNTLSGTQKLKEWNRHLLDLTQKREQLQQSLQKNHPNYTALTKSEMPTIPSLQQGLPDSNTAAVEYFLGQRHSYAFFITKKGIVLEELADASSLNKKVAVLMQHLKLNRQNSLSAFMQVAHELYQELLGSFDLSGIYQLIIIPDGSLSYLPFEMLLPTQSEKSSPKQFDYLLKSYTISYAYSLALLKLQQQETHPGGKVLIVAPVFKNDPAKYLRHSEEDISNFQYIKHTSLKHQEATIDNFLSYAPDFSLLYFSTHASAGDSLGGQPAIEFIDDQLFLSDLYTLNLSTQLVVLSACQTGIGGQRRGEGIMSLARGFTYAGVPSVITSLWKVNESATHTIIEDFYRYLAAGKHKDEALRLAKMDFLQQSDDIQATPYYWASFIVIGNTQPFSFEKKIPWKTIISSTFFLLIILYVSRKKLN